MTVTPRYCYEQAARALTAAADDGSHSSSLAEQWMRLAREIIRLPDEPTDTAGCDHPEHPCPACEPAAPTTATTAAPVIIRRAVDQAVEQATRYATARAARLGRPA